MESLNCFASSSHVVRLTCRGTPVPAVPFSFELRRAVVQSSRYDLYILKIVTELEDIICPSENSELVQVQPFLHCSLHPLHGHQSLRLHCIL